MTLPACCCSNYPFAHRAKLLVAEDGETAIELVRENNDIDMVLMDIRLTGISGLQATERIKKIAPDI